MWYHALGDLISLDPAACLHQDPVQAFQFFIEIQRTEMEIVTVIVVYSVTEKTLHAQALQ